MRLPHSITPDALHERLRAGDSLTVLDVRNRDEFESWRVSGPGVDARQLPLTRVVAAEATGGVGDLAAGFDGPVVVVCARGESSDHVAELLRNEGADAANLDGGMDAWARLYVARELDDAPDDVSVVQYQRPSSGCLGYLLVADDEAAVVDPLRAFAERYAADAAERGATLRYALDTHVHADHVSGVRAVAERSDAEMIAPAGARDRGLAFDARLVEDGEALPLGGASVTVFALPGHTSELVGYRVGDALLSGDTVFLENVARPDLEIGHADARAAARTLHGTIRERLLSLPPETLVAPGHHGDATLPADDGTYIARLDALRERLPALSMGEEEFLEYVTSHMPPQPANFETIVAINLGLDEADDAAAFALELGPNNCAATAD